MRQQPPCSIGVGAGAGAGAGAGIISTGGTANIVEDDRHRAANLAGYFIEDPFKLLFCGSASQGALEDLHGHDWIGFRFTNKDFCEDLLPCLDDRTRVIFLDMIQFAKAFIPHAAVSRLCFRIANNTKVFCTNSNLHRHVLGEVVGVCFA